MAKDITEITYNENEDILSFWRGNPSNVSIEIGDFIIDVDSSSHIAGFEIMNASENLNIPDKFLANIEKASMSVLYKPNYVYIMLKIKLKEKEKDISIPLTLDLGHKKLEREEVVFQRQFKEPQN
ncbi:MAG: DUF2283 domain-containing protein [Nanoarchaeota archaeon]|nr:DUF2283 domain-containing protein [Nanoarchaeota archaeon]MBU1104025.1 DUF2283 domain-containing protein [Nanoarchaeota archaeon]